MRLEQRQNEGSLLKPQYEEGSFPGQTSGRFVERGVSIHHDRGAGDAGHGGASVAARDGRVVDVSFRAKSLDHAASVHQPVRWRPTEATGRSDVAAQALDGGF